jgi:chromosome partitioning protein
MPILLLINLKGGVAKTTNAVAIAECFASQGLRTLMIDADHQCMAGELLLGESRLLRCERSKSTLHDLLAAMLDEEFDSEQIGGYVTNSASNIGGGMKLLSVIPCSVRIDDFSTNMAKARRGYQSTDEFLQVFARRRQQLRGWLAANFDFILIDCPPSLALQVRAFLSVAEGFIVPAVPDRLSVRGSLYLLERIPKSGHSKIRSVGTLWSLFREQNHVHRGIVDKCRRRVEPYNRLPRPFETVIPNATAIADSSDPDKSPISFKAKYTPPFAKLYERLCEEIVARTQWQVADRKTDGTSVLSASRGRGRPDPNELRRTPQ